MKEKCKCCGQEVEAKELEEEKPVIVGYTQRLNGFNYFKTIEIGSPIYSFGNYIFLEHELISDGSIHRIKYYKDDLDNL